MPEAIQTKHLPSSKTYVRDAIKVLRYLHCTNKSFSDQNIKGNFLKLHVLKISNQEKFFEIFVFGKNDTGPEIAKKNNNNILNNPIWKYS